MSLCLMPSDCKKCDKKSITNILKGEMSANIEELHILKPKISWSPNSQKLLVAAKSKGSDVLFIINIENG